MIAATRQEILDALATANRCGFGYSWRCWSEDRWHPRLSRRLAETATRWRATAQIAVWVDQVIDEARTLRDWAPTTWNVRCKSGPGQMVPVWERLDYGVTSTHLLFLPGHVNVPVGEIVTGGDGNRQPFTGQVLGYRYATGLLPPAPDRRARRHGRYTEVYLYSSVHDALRILALAKSRRCS